MLNLEYTSFQYMIVYIAVLQVGTYNPLFLQGLILTRIQGGLGAGQWLSYGPSKSYISSSTAEN
jgi:hypothetical protein